LVPYRYSSEQLGILLSKADAVIYSFGLGKGLDTGGGLLLTAETVENCDLKSNPKNYYVGNLLKGCLLHLLGRSGIYPYILGKLESEIDEAKKPDFKEISEITGAPSDIYLLWEEKYRSYMRDIQKARHRAREIGLMPHVQKLCRDIPVYFGSDALHLRQIIRFHDIAIKSKVIKVLQRNGVDCVSAGEQLPSEYFETSVADDFPNARTFREDSIRLPFLGRLSEKMYSEFMRKLEDALVQHIH